MASPYDLTTLGELKNFISPAASNLAVADAILQQIITGVSKAFNRFLSRELMCVQWTEVRNGNNRQAMRTLVYPIISIQSVVIAPMAGQPGQILTLAQGQSGIGTVTNDSWFIYLNPGWFGSVFQKGYQNVTLTYTAGFITPGQVALLSSPAWMAGQTVAPGFQIQANGQIYQVIIGGTTGNLPGPYFPNAQNSIVRDNGVVWLAVGAIPAFPAMASLLPEDITLACNQQCALVSKNRTRVGDTATGVGPERISFFLKGMTEHTRELLKQHKEVFPTEGMGVDRLLVTGSAAGGPQPTQVFYDDQPLAGSQDGVNLIFTLPSVPNPQASLQVYKNGVLQDQGLNYTLNQTVVTFVIPPASTDVLVAFYRGWSVI